MGKLIASLNFWQLFLLLRVVIFVALIIIILVYCLVKRKRISKALIVVLVLLFLLIPNKTMIKDGGSKMYWAPLYEVIVWNQLDSSDEQGNIIPGKKGVDVYIFPYNTKDFD